jgi:hypothetical protein
MHLRGFKIWSPIGAQSHFISHFKIVKSKLTLYASLYIRAFKKIIQGSFAGTLHGRGETG